MNDSMVKVPRDQFFERLYDRCAAGQDIMPAITKDSWPYHSTWADVRTKEVFGRSEGTGQYRDGFPVTLYFLRDRTER